MSLRARLVTGVVSLAAIGLIALAAVTYYEQSSFLEDRVDQQLASAIPAVERELREDSGIAIPGGPGKRPGRFPHNGPLGGPGPGDGPGRNVNLPPGTYGERRDANGKSLGSTSIDFTGDELSAPDVPLDVKSDVPITVDSKDGEVQYRAVAHADATGATIAAVPLIDNNETLDRLLLVEIFVILVVLAALAALAWWIVAIGLRPLDRIGDTAGAIAAGDLSHRVEPATEKTEVGRLGLSLNRMLGRLEEAFAERRASEDRLRTFLADASHELRTPLVSIRGYAELFRLGAAEDPKELAKAMRRIEEEATRMGMLVEDMLTLARLDEVQSSERHDISLADIARDTVSDARVTDPDRTIEVHSDGESLVHADPNSMRQVLANLMGNALTHTPAGTRIDVTVSRGNGTVTASVRDHGHGLPVDDADALFERFWRASPGRGRGRAGAGLGLAIVAGIVQTHGGRVSARNAEGGGAVFEVELPAA